MIERAGDRLIEPDAGRRYQGQRRLEETTDDATGRGSEGRRRRDVEEKMGRWGEMIDGVGEGTAVRGVWFAGGGVATMQ